MCEGVPATEDDKLEGKLTAQVNEARILFKRVRFERDLYLFVICTAVFCWALYQLNMVRVGSGTYAGVMSIAFAVSSLICFVSHYSIKQVLVRGLVMLVSSLAIFATAIYYLIP